MDDNATTSADGDVPEGTLAALEARWPNGVTSAQVVAFFQGCGVRLSEATFRRYVQLGFLPRCRRVGRKGKHRGSQGIYPTVVVRRLAEVKRLLDEGRTIEEIRGLFRVREDDVQEVRERLAAILGALEDQLRETPDEILARDVAELRGTVAALESGLRRVAADVARGRLRAQMAV
ncbi:MAG: MerR family transcriptional regulator [Deltaproteobacteria bacterium]|nr:MerR family transcriptional regulator [Deltaproteobacteria bacterium]